MREWKINRKGYDGMASKIGDDSMIQVKAYGGTGKFVFVSYAHLDKDEVLPVIDYLQRLGYNIWFDEGIVPGDDWNSSIGSHIDECACFMAFISSRFAASGECAKEVDRGLNMRKTMVNVFLSPTDLSTGPFAGGLAEGVLAIQGIEKFKYPNEAQFYVKLVDHRCFEECRDTEAFQMRGDTLVKYNDTSTRVALPDTVTGIGYNAFEECSSLRFISIPKSVDRIGKFAFNNMPRLQDIEVDERNGFFRSADGVLFNKAGNYLLRYPSARVGSEYRVPGGVTHIAMIAFSQAKALSDVQMPECVSYIGDRAFEACHRLIDVRLGSRIEKVRAYTFSRCSSLVSCELPLSIREIGDGAFSGCVSLEHIDLPDSLCTLGEMAFAHCESLASVRIPPSVEFVPEYCFHECSNLIDVDLGSVREVRQYAFKNCEALESVRLPEGLEVIGRAAFSGCASLKELTVPGSVREIGAYAFDRCGNLSRVVIEDGVESICEGAFADDGSLAEIVLPKSVKRVEGLPFPDSTTVVRR